MRFSVQVQIFEIHRTGKVETTFSGRRLFVPNIANRKDGRMDMLEIYSDQDIASLPSGKWGIREPAPEWQGRRRASSMPVFHRLKGLS